MKLIYITGGFPYPLTSGFLRHYHLLERLARDHEIKLFSMLRNAQEPGDREAVEALGVEVRTFDGYSTPARRWVAKAARVSPRLVGGGGAELRRAVAECVESGWPDAVFFAGKSTGLFQVLGDVPVLVDACDATSMRLESRLAERSGVERVLARIELRTMRSNEDYAGERGDHVIVASRRDGEALGWNERMSVVANGVDTAYWTRRAATRPRDTIIFTGKMSYHPNEYAAMQLIHEVLPAVRERRPDARLLIVGTSPRPALVEAGRQPGVEVTGRVDDMRDYLDRATVFAAPIRHGAGIQNKLLEALSMGLPVVASSNASDGLVVDGERPPVVTTDDLSQMASSIVEALEVADDDPSPITSNREWVAARFDWDASARRVDEILHAITGGRHREAHTS